jgi:tRNA(fMet)-specific endonuclease VapC
MKYLLDTNICIALIRQKPASLLQRLTSLQPGEVGISSITLAELTYGAVKSSHPEQNMSALEQFILPLDLADFDQKAAWAYGQIRASLEHSGVVIGSMDMLIAAHAISLNVILVTNNAREFQRVRGLIIEDWISESG